PVRLNQVGFLPKAQKLAVITVVTTVDSFVVMDQQQRVVYRGTLSPEKKSEWSPLKTRVADFTSFSSPGVYTISIKGLAASWPFTIGDKVYDTISKAVIRGFYFQRSDMALPETFAGKWARPAGHADTEVLVHPSAAGPGRPAGTKITSPGGWYDAGDYNKYIVNSGITMGTLLSAYEDFPGYYRNLELGIPETGNGIPDLLDEVLYNLRWMLTMQDPADGGVYHKCTNAAFDGMVMPGEGRAPRYVVQKSTAAALDFAAVTAQSARVFAGYKQVLPGLADSCLEASAKAWKWAVKNPALMYDQDKMNREFTPPVSTGGYGDNRVEDEWFWAAVELYISTGDKIYQPVVARHLNDAVTVPSWGTVATLGVYSLLRSPGGKQPAGLDLSVLKKNMRTTADTFLARKERNAFHTVMGQSLRDFIWGSNAVAANQGILLVNVYRMTGDRRYLDGAISNLDYLLGRNATGYSFVTGIGSKTPMFPHHRPSVADRVEEPVPGLLVGGPNPGRQDKCDYAETDPETAYSDVSCSYASNEIAINWNAPIVYLANAIQAIGIP
ncbi:MAG: cellulase, partial [Chitinophagaceae bacterium]